MRIAVDFGNSRIKLALFQDGSYVPAKESTINYEQSFEETFLNAYADIPCIYAAVRLDADKIEWLKNRFTCYQLSHRSKLPFELDYRTPETLGVDRIAACAGAFMHAEAPFLVIDSGTCITFDLVDEKYVYRGGAISPGISMRLRAMHEFTDALPKLDVLSESFLQNSLGKDTASCMISAAVNGTTYELDGFIRALGQGSALKTVVTGAWAEDLANKLENTTFVAPNLVLPGLIKILELNEL